ncbi:hypothetical protein N7528_010297 [Penicillium herquei]|nr:hypothetical protein N7528_010297 [Penicillium herquei]
MASDPCAACGWTIERQARCRYESQVSLFYEAGNRGVWSLGSSLILKDRGSKLPVAEASNIHFVRTNTSIPVPSVIESWEENEHYLLLMRRIPGEPLNKAWPKLSTVERENIAKQTASYLEQLRNLQSEQIQSLGGNPVYSNFLFKNKTFQQPHGPFLSDDYLWNDMKAGLTLLPEAAQVQLRASMPPTTPYTFTHGDLTNVNIIVQNGNLAGIIDWEMSGFFPVWWEYVCTSIADSEDDMEWKALLRKYMSGYDNAREFWLDYYHICKDPNCPRAQKFVE